MFLFDNMFPEVLCVEMFSIWVDIEEVSKLDSAICNSVDRISYLNIVNNTTCKNERVNNSKKFLSWVCSRGVSLTMFSLTVDNIPLRPILNLKQLNTVQISSCCSSEATEIVEFLNSCPKLTSVDLSPCEIVDIDSMISLLNSDIIKQLKTFKCGMNLSNESMKRLSESCLNLTQLECVTRTCDGYLHHLFAKNPKIVSLNVRAKTPLCDSFFTSVASKLPRLARLLVRADCECDLLSSAEHVRSQVKIFGPSVDWVYVTPHMTYRRHSKAVRLYSCTCIHEAVVDFLSLTAGMFRSMEMRDVCVDDLTLRAISQHHPGLEGLSLSQTTSTSFTVHGMQSLLIRCGNLHYLEIGGEHKSLTSDEFCDMFSVSNNVTQLIFTGNHVIVNESITRLLDCNKQLVTLNCLHCRFLSYDELMFHKYQNNLKVQVFVHEF